MMIFLVEVIIFEISAILRVLCLGFEVPLACWSFNGCKQVTYPSCHPSGTDSDSPEKEGKDLGRRDAAMDYDSLAEAAGSMFRRKV
jgi:hypothetical protein